MTKIDQPIVEYSVVDSAAPIAPPALESMHEGLTRPESLAGRTYKIKTPILEHALYVTISDIVLNQGTANMQSHPFEVFVNCKDMENFAWVTALTRVMSAVFRKGGDVTFLIAELKSVFDPKGGYFKRGGKYMPSVVAEIGEVIERHLIDTGVIKTEVDRVPAYKGPVGGKPEIDLQERAEVCPKCHHKALVKLDGCHTCLECGDGKCG